MRDGVFGTTHIHEYVTYQLGIIVAEMVYEGRGTVIGRLHSVEPVWD